ncbi:LLM class flavin-dependent oxidoreductase [Xanthobacter autotrophicus]|jgi:FMN-dependent oxidoreductase (nitrilotriacetate monooxygenase family)|uniref:LLM class flavin-dependent oxidoreductase n=1 Tax=Xanthobacter autotrophicus TaxID=280 RepID=UPI00372691B2
MAGRTLHLNVNILNAGFYSSAWRMPSSDPSAFAAVDHYVRIAQIAERGTFDAVFLADVPAFSDRPEYRPFQALEPTIVLARVAAATDRIGLIGTASTTYNDPYNLARRFASLDIASGGRVGWNIVTTADPSASRNFGFDDVTAHATRYARAGEFAEVVKALWDSWEDDALVGDKATGRFIDTSKVHAIDHKGPFFDVKGPLNVPRSVQGRPVLVQAGGSRDGQALAARHAEAIFSVAHTLEEALAFATAIRTEARACGRSGDDIVILPGLGTIIGSTQAEARRREEELWSLMPGDYGLRRVAGLLKVDPASLDLDGPLPGTALPTDGMQTFFQALVGAAQRDGLTVRQLIRKFGGSTGHRVIVGTPEQVADDIEAWFRAGAADGFNLMPDVLPEGLEVFVDHVVPLLRRRGLFRHGYTGRTLREHFGLDRPESRYAQSRYAPASAASSRVASGA